jgi:hypothetical protein
MSVAAAVMLLGVVLIVLALVAWLVLTIVALWRIVAALEETITAVGEIVTKSGPVNGIVTTINRHLDAGVSALEGLLVKKAGLRDALGLVDGLYPGASEAGFRDVPGSEDITPPRVSEVYTRGVLQLARLGREAPIATLSPEGPVLRDVKRSSAASYPLYPDVRHTRPEKLPRSPVIGVDSPVQYEPSEEPGVRRRMPAGANGDRSNG